MLNQSDKSEESPSLHRALGTFAATAFVVTSMVGTGIFTVPAYVRIATGSGVAALGVWIVGAVLALSGALCYAELATRMPHAGGEYQYLSQVFGKMSGFVCGWITFFAGFAAPIAASSLGAVAYFSPLIPGWNPDTPIITGWSISQGSVIAASLAIIMAIVHSIGVRPSGRLQTLLAITTVCSIIIFVGAGFATGRGNFQGITQISQASGTWWIALIQVSFAYTGWNAAAYLAGEVKNPRKTLPRALIGGTLIVVLLYLALNLLFFYALPANAWQPTIAVGQVAAEHLFGAAGGRVLTAIVTIIILGSISAWTASGPRVYFAMAQDGIAPKIFQRLNSQRTPAFATMIQAVVAATMALSGAFEKLLIYVGSGLLLFSGITIAAVYFARRKQIAHAPSYFRVPGYPFTPAIFIALVLVSWVQSLREQPIPTGAALVTIIVGVVIYYGARALGWIVEQAQPIPQPSEQT